MYHIDNVDAVKGLRHRGDVQLKSYSLNTTIKVALKYYKCLNTPVALSCFLLAKHGEYDQLVSKGINPLEYVDGEKFAADYAAVKFLSKCAGLPTSFDLEHAALKQEAWAEAMCKQTNLRIVKTFPSYRVNRIRCIAQDILTDILGETPSLEEIVMNLKYGPGATSATASSDTTIVAKVSQQLFASADLIDDLNAVLQHAPYLSKEVSETLDFRGPIAGRLNPDSNCNEYTSVPKNAKTNRAIAIPDHFRSLGQGALGRILRSRLRHSKYKLNLDDLWKLNQEYARQGSIGQSSDGYHYVTVDVTCASSTIAFEAVFDLLPRSWAMLCDRWRESHTKYGDYLHENHKFSSMGNGFTFELESIFFFALAKASQIVNGEKRAFCSSFGDDIITTRSSYNDLCDLFSFYGLTVNNNKSFTSGYFRESCGADYWQGARINPPYLKEIISDESDIVKLANRIRDYSSRIRFGYYCDIRFKPVWHCLIDLLPSNTAYSYGSRDFGDTCIWFSIEDRGFTTPISSNGSSYTRIIAKVACRRKQRRFENKLGTWAYLSDGSCTSLPDRQNNARVSFIPEPIAKPYGLGQKIIQESLKLTSGAVLPVNKRGETGRFSAIVACSYGVETVPPWR